MTSDTAGYVRLRGQGREGFPLVGGDLIPEVQQEDGTWIRLRGVCSVDLHIPGAQIVTAQMELEIHALDLELATDQITIRYRDLIKDEVRESPAVLPGKVCARCRWAVARGVVAQDYDALHCERVEEPESLAMLESPVDGGLVVDPSFGCCLWEAKP